MKKLIFALSVGAMMLGTANVSARSLSPDEALSMATAQMRKSFGKAQAMQLAYTLPSEQNGQNALYVFANPQGGFAVIAADDVVDQLLLGYSDGTFDADNLAPAFDWYLRASAASVDGQIATATPDRQRVTRAAQEFAPIAPLVTTKWNQGDPFNQQCPVVAGGRSVTGCVATAMAQVANYHKWPQTGQGTKTYQFSYNGVNYSDTFNYGATSFDWDNMLDVYTSTATTAQQDAVAELMHACGVACEMKYTPYESGSNYFTASAGLVNYMNYDKSMTLLDASWYPIDEWNEVIYNELAANRPILYSGADITGAGHAFVCDGYASDGMFHINWGWGGSCDGYFILPDLLPDSQGIGGGSGQSGFNFGQNALLNVKPDEGGDYPVIMGVEKKFATGAESYNRNASTQVSFTGGFFSYSTVSINVTLGIHLVGDGIDQYLTYSTANLSPGYGYNTMSFRATNFPVGQYQAYPAYKPANGEWQHMYFDRRQTPDGVTLNVTSTTINVVDTSAEATAEFTEITPQNPADGDNLYNGNIYNVTYDITSTGSWSSTVQVAICTIKDQSLSIVGLGDSRTVIFGEAGSQAQTFTLPIPLGISTGDYYLCLTYNDGSYFYLMSDLTPITITALQPSGEGSLVSVTGTGNFYSSAQTLSVDNATVKFVMKATTAPWTDRFYVLYWKTIDKGNSISLSYASESTQQWVNIDEVNGTATLEFDAKFPGCDYDEVYAVSLIKVSFDSSVADAYVPLNGRNYFYYKISNDITINDATAYANDKDIEDVDITYVREFNNTSWQPLYVPFDMEYADWADQAEIAQLEGVIMYDYDHDGTIDRTVVTFTSVTSGTVKANTPYVIKANAEGTATFTVEGATLKAATNNYVDCSTTSHNFYLRGVYETKTGLDLSNEYIMGGGAFYHTTGGVKPMRFYLQKEARGSYGSHAPQRASADGTPDDVIYVEVDGVQTDGIFDFIATPASDDMLYDLQGRRVVNPTPGIYVRNGKKVIIK